MKLRRRLRFTNQRRCHTKKLSRCYKYWICHFDSRCDSLEEYICVLLVLSPVQPVWRPVLSPILVN